ncbi:MAG: putative LPS assembly protein LptD [Candidatus Zixiibacteriota bacterium]
MKRVLSIIFLISFAFAARIELIHAGRLESTLSGEGELRLSGGVYLREGNRDLKSNSAKWNRNNDKVNFWGDVYLLDDDFSLLSKTLFYSRQEGYASATGDVKFITVDSNLVVTGLFGEYYNADSQLVMTGEPHLTRIDTSDSSKLDVDAKKLQYFRKIPLGVATGNVKCTIEDLKADEPPMNIECDSLAYDFELDVLYAYKNVKVIQGDQIAHADSGLLDRKDNLIYLTGRPILSDPTSRLEGDEIIISIKDNKLENMRVTGDAKGNFKDLEHPDKKTSTFEADNMTFIIEDGQIERAYLTRQVDVEYYPIPEDTTYEENLNILGDSVVVWFVEQQMDSVRVLGGLDGEYIKTKSKFVKSDSDSVAEDSVETLDTIKVTATREDPPPLRGIDKARKQIVSSDTLNFKAEAGEFSISQNIVRLAGSADMSYDDMSLQSYYVTYDVDGRLLTANAFDDTDSLVQRPILNQAGSSLRGDKMLYNIETERGRVIHGWSQVSPGFFWGDKLQKAAGDTLYAKGGKFTTCDHEIDSIDYHFYSPQIKLIPKDKAFAKHVLLYIRELPVFYLPFFVFPTKTGRRSGLLSAEIGQFHEGRRFIRNVGYYWAPNDYMDWTTAFDFDEDYGLKLRNKLRYALRYKLSGSIGGNYAFERESGWDETATSQRWDLRFSHRQTINEETRITASGSFVSSKEFLEEQYLTPEESMDRDLHSSINITTRILGMSVNGSLNRNENLETGRITEYLPQLKWTKYTTSLGKEDTWLENVKYSYNGSYKNYRRKGDDVEDVYNQGIDNRLGLSVNMPVQPYFTFTPQTSARLTAFDEDNYGEKYPVRFTYDAGAGLSTNLYGTIPFRIGALRELKHVFSPKFNYSWSPKFENLDKYPSLMGSAGSSQERMDLRISANNNFSLRYKKDDEMKKIRLFTLSSNTSYDFKATGEQRKFADITSTMSAKPSNFLDMSLSATHSLYREGSNEIDGLWLKNARFQTTMRLDGDFKIDDMSKNWRISVNHYLSKSFTTGAVEPSQWLKASIKTDITKKWHINYDIYYDINDTKRISESFYITRDMHCWEGIIKWIPSGARKGYYFKIAIKELPDIKIEGSRGGVR